MANLMLFTDGSADPRSRVGFGASLLLREEVLVDQSDSTLASLKANIALKRFENTSSTTLELQVLLWALNNAQLLVDNKKLTIYTDSQNIIGLPVRRERLEKNNYCASNNKRLNNSQLYQQFFYLTDQLDCQLVKVSGHQASARKTPIDRIFALVDKASRSALRELNQSKD